jgi:hypothetical protein
VTLNPGYRDQQLMVEAIERRAQRLSPRERLAEAIVGGCYALAALLLLLLAPADAASISVVAAGSSSIALALALRVEFATGSGVTVPSQLAFVPLLFTLPPALVPLAVPALWAASKIPDVVRGICARRVCWP